MQRSNRQKACPRCRQATEGHRPVGFKRKPDPVCVDCRQRYPRRGGPTVTRCVSCQAAHVEREQAARLARIEASTPPAGTLEGQLQRRVRDRKPVEEFEIVFSGGEGLTSF